MPSDVCVVVADPTRMPAIRLGMLLPGRAQYFTTANLAAAVECARNQEPKLVAVDALWAQSALGLSFIERIEKLAIAGAEVRLIARLEGRWVTMSRDPISIAANPSAQAPAKPAPPIVMARPRTVVAAQMAVASTRRAPRFVVRDPVSAVVESGSATLVDISVLGAQIVSAPVLRPNQKIKVALPDTGDMLHVMAHVKWSTFEQPSASSAHYRAGLEFSGAAQQALEDYRLRHCAAEPIPYRGC